MLAALAIIISLHFLLSGCYLLSDLCTPPPSKLQFLDVYFNSLYKGNHGKVYNDLNYNNQLGQRCSEVRVQLTNIIAEATNKTMSALNIPALFQKMGYMKKIHSLSFSYDGTHNKTIAN